MAHTGDVPFSACMESPRAKASLVMNGVAVGIALLCTLLSAIPEVSSASECREADPPDVTIALFFAAPVIAVAGLLVALVERRRGRTRGGGLAVVGGTATLIWAGAFMVYLVAEAFECFTF